jgi:hypothetical protein
MWFTRRNYYKLAVEKDRCSIFTTIWKPGFCDHFLFWNTSNEVHWTHFKRKWSQKVECLATFCTDWESAPVVTASDCQVTWLIAENVSMFSCGPRSRVRHRSLIMGGGGGWENVGGFNYFCLNWGRPQTEKYLTSGDPNFLILSYSFSICRLYRIPQNISPFLVPITVVFVVYYVYAVHHRSRSK